MSSQIPYATFSEECINSDEPVVTRIRKVSSSFVSRTRRTLSILEPRRDLSFFGGVLFVMGESAGCGMLTLPKMVADTGWIGILILVLVSLSAVYTGHLLTSCWTMVLERHPMDTAYIPYQAIGYRTFGQKMRSLVAILHSISLFGLGTVALVLSSDILQTLFDMAGFTMSHCYWMLILAVFCCPLTWLGGSEYMNTIVIISGLGSMISSLLILATTITVALESASPVTPSPSPSPGDRVRLWTVLSGFGSVAFTFAGHASYPNIQSNVQRPYTMSWILLTAYIIICIVYYPLAIVPFYTLGKRIRTDDVQVSLMPIASAGWLLVISQILMCCHLVTKIIISLNPFLMEAEKMVGVRNVADRTGIKQIMTRAMLFSMCLFIAQSLPNFAAILSLIGSSTEVLLSYVLPCVFYEKLCSMDQEDGDEDEGRRRNPVYIKLLHHQLIIAGLILGIGGSYVALSTLFGDATFVPPCYTNVTIGIQN